MCRESGGHPLLGGNSTILQTTTTERDSINDRLPVGIALSTNGALGSPGTSMNHHHYEQANGGMKVCCTKIEGFA